MYSHPSFFLSFCWVDPPESGRLALHAQSFLVDLIVDEELNKRINQKIIYIFLTNLPYIYFFALFFYLLLHRLAVRIRLPFYDFLQVIIVLLQAYYWEFRHHSTVCCCELADILYFRAEQPSSSSPSSSSLSWSSSSPSLSSSSSLLFEPQYPAIGSVE